MRRRERGSSVVGPVRAGVLAVALSLGLGCRGTDAGARDADGSPPGFGVSFELPAGMSHLSAEERAARGGADRIMIGDAARSHVAFVAALELSPDERAALGSAGDGVAARLWTAAMALRASLPERYLDYEELSGGPTELGGRPAAEIVFLGREGAEDRRWRRIVVSYPDESDSARFLMLGIGCPEAEADGCRAEAAALDATWSWSG